VVRIEKSEVIERFEFMKDIFGKVDHPGFSKQDLCGVFFYKNRAYSTNNHIIGRISTKQGFPSEELLFWSYCQNAHEVLNDSKLKLSVSSKAINMFRSNFSEDLDKIFDSYTENYFFIRRTDILSSMPTLYKTDAAKSKVFVHAKIDKINLKFIFLDKKGKRLDNSEVQLLTTAGKTTRISYDCSFSVNLLYLYKVIFHSFCDCDIIGFKLKEDNYQHPIIVFNKHNSLNRPQIHWSIAQTLLKIK
jgi:hypothetical protein